MEFLAGLLRNSPEARKAWERYKGTEITSEEYLQRKIDRMNAIEGDLEGQDCRKCRNKGVIYFMQDGCEVAMKCECLKARESRRRLKASGLEKLIERYRLDNFQCFKPWQEAMRRKAEAFLAEGGDSWFFAGGQPGIGKTHLCTAIAGELLSRGNQVIYMLWRDESVKLKANVNESEYQKSAGLLKNCEVLYIDDLFKTQYDEFSGKPKPPTVGDVNLAFEILNYRYNNRLKTIISSEHTIDGLIRIDEAAGSRIYEMSKKFCVSFSRDPSKNQRMV